MNTGTGLSAGRIMSLGLGFQRACVILAAVELGVFTTLAAAQHLLSLSELCDRLGLAGRGARDFLDALTAMGFLQRDESGRYANTPATGAFLVPGRPGYVGGVLELMSSGGYDRWGRLSEALRTGKPPGPAAGGADAFAEIYADSRRLRVFAGAMGSLSAFTAPALAERFPWRDYRTFADIGCAYGLLPATLAAHHPHLTGTGFDLPALRPLFEAHIRDAGLADRVSFHAGDFLTDELPAADVLIFSRVLHDWGLPVKRDLLAKAYRALPPGGAVIIQECFIDAERRTALAGILMSLSMLLETAEGFDATTDECKQWLAEAGFGSLSELALTPTESIVTGTKEP